jgi:hypothetical protein
VDKFPAIQRVVALHERGNGRAFRDGDVFPVNQQKKRRSRSENQAGGHGRAGHCFLVAAAFRVFRGAEKSFAAVPLDGPCRFSYRACRRGPWFSCVRQRSRWPKHCCLCGPLRFRQLVLAQTISSSDASVGQPRKVWCFVLACYVFPKVASNSRRIYETLTERAVPSRKQDQAGQLPRRSS